MSSLENIGSQTFYEPENEEELRALILRAKAEKVQIRVRGSAHSVKKAIFTDDFNSETPRQPDKGINLMLSKPFFKKFSLDTTNKTVTVGGGCNLGKDPFDPTESSTLQNSFLFQLNQAGFSIPDVGGIIHQTVGGFLSTGSSGGSLQYSIDDSIVSMKFMDGNGIIHTVSRNDANTDLFYGFGVSMGLMGIILEVTFQYDPSFDIKGTETTSTYEYCEVDLFGNGTATKPSLETFLQQTEYTRLIWWPQDGVEKMVVWQAHHMKPDEYNAQTGTQQNFKPKVYQEFPFVLGTPIPAEIAADLLYTLIGTWPVWFHNIMGNSKIYDIIVFIADAAFPKYILPAIINAFVPDNYDKDGVLKKGCPQEFWDIWWHGLPMDNQVNDNLIPVEFTELWIPVSQSQYVMSSLKEFYEDNKKAQGTFSCEIYGAKKSGFWLSPAYNEDVIRVDLFWFAKNTEDARTYYLQFWIFLRDLLNKHNSGFRCHWGKYLPEDINAKDKNADLKKWAEYLQKQYPKWNDFMKLRTQFDPNNVFLTDYWKKHLGI